MLKLVQRSAALRNAVQRSAMQCSASAVQCSAVPAQGRVGAAKDEASAAQRNAVKCESTTYWKAINEVAITPALLDGIAQQL